MIDLTPHLEVIREHPELTPREREFAQSFFTETAIEGQIDLGSLIRAIRDNPDLSQRERRDFLHLLMTESVKIKEAALKREEMARHTPHPNDQTYFSPDEKTIFVQIAQARLNKKIDAYGIQVSKIFSQAGQIGTDINAMPIVKDVPINNFLSNADTVHQANYGTKLPCIDKVAGYDRTYLVMDPAQPDAAMIVSYDSQYLADLCEVFRSTNDRQLAPRVVSHSDFDETPKKGSMIESRPGPKTSGGILVIKDFAAMNGHRILKHKFKGNTDINKVIRKIAVAARKISNTRPQSAPLN